MNRREFLRRTGLAAAACWYPSILSAQPGPDRTAAADELETDVVIIGGGLGGCAAAMAASGLGARVLMTEPTDWIGGQLTQQAVPPDENRWIESFGATASYRRFRENVRQYYRDHYPLTPEARARQHLDPGDGSVSRLCHEPRVALAVLDQMLAPAADAGRLSIRLGAVPVRADVAGDRIRAVHFRDLEGREFTARAKYFIDASEMGDLLPLSGAEYVTGSESKAQTGEPNAAEEPRPANMQACTWCYALEYLPGEDHTIDRPADYDFWRRYRPELQPPWPDRLLTLWYTHPSSGKPLELSFVPPDPAFADHRTKTLNLWHYRRIIHRENFAPGRFPSDITIVNWPQNDYLLGNLFENSPEEQAKHREGARQLSLSLLYWLQTEAPRPDGKNGWPGLRLSKDTVGTEDGLAKYPYIRESRRIQAEFTILEQHLRTAAEEKIGNVAVARPFGDSVGIGHYALDLHPTTGGDNYFDVGCYPFQIPLGALIPRRMENLLAGCKNIGTTHITNGAYRLHPIEWNIGEAAGAVAAFCLRTGLSPRGVRNGERTLADFQQLLVRSGFVLDWSKLAEL